jgi:competence protein ComEC
MPLLALGVVAYAGGLLLGFSGHAMLAAALAFATAWVAVHLRRITPAALTLLMAGGAATAASASARDRACLDAALRTGRVVVAFDAAADAGVFARGWAVRCHVPVSVAVVAGSAHAGDVVVVRGRVGRGRRGLDVQAAELGAPVAMDRMRRWRAAVGERVDLLFGSDAPLARALLVADQGQIPAEVRSQFAAAGLAHMLAISGLHVGLIALAVALVLDLARVSRRRAEVVTVVAVAGYVLLLGAPAPAARAAAMLGVLVASRRLQRPTSPWAVLAIGAALPLRDPRAVLSVGYQLSVGGVAALIAASALAGRWRGLARRPKFARALIGTMLASTVATIVTAPLVAWNFGRLSLVGPLSNVVAAPIMGMVQPMLFVALVLSPVPGLAHWFVDGAHPLLRAFNFVASVAADVPGGSVVVLPSALTVVLGVVFAVALVTACVSRFPARATVLALGALTALAWRPMVPMAPGRASFHVIDVGQGHAFAMRTARGRWIVMDAGRRWMAGDDGRRTIVPYVAHRGGSVPWFVLTGDRPDDAGGAASVVSRLHPGGVLDGGSGRGSAAYREMLLAARNAGASWRRAESGDSLVVDDVVLRVLRPRHGTGRDGIAVVAETDGMRVVVAPDLPSASIDELAAPGTAGRSDRVAPDVLITRDVARIGPRAVPADLLPGITVYADGDSLLLASDGDEWRVARQTCSRRATPPASPDCHPNSP